MEDKKTYTTISPGGAYKRKPSWIRSKWPCTPDAAATRQVIRQNKLLTVCEEAACPNLGECFSCGTATFMIMGNFCTRNCSFCNVSSIGDKDPKKSVINESSDKSDGLLPNFIGIPVEIDPHEPGRLADIVLQMKLRYVVITSVTRDDLSDGGASHFSACIKAIREKNPGVKVEILTPDFRHCMDNALTILKEAIPDTFSHNIETVPRLYKTVRPHADYKTSLELLKKFKEHCSTTPTKSGLILGLGENMHEILQVLKDLVSHGVEKLVLGQYLQPTKDHFKVHRYVPLRVFSYLEKVARDLGFKHVVSSPLARSSYRAGEC